MHIRALDVVELSLVWPRRVEDNKPITLPDLDKSQLFDKDLNSEQIQAVANVLHGTSGRVPFLLFGAFGTGKSKTVLEMIKQV